MRIRKWSCFILIVAIFIGMTFSLEVVQAEAQIGPMSFGISSDWSWNAQVLKTMAEQRLGSIQMRLKPVVQQLTASKAADAKKKSNDNEATATVVYTDKLFAPPYKQVLNEMKVIATGYTAGMESTGKNPGHPSYGITYSGVKVRRDYVSTIAADLGVFPLGSILYIPGYGYGIVADIGGKIKGNHIDLYFDTTKQVYNQWGKKTVEVQVIRKGSGKVTEQMINDLSAEVMKYKSISKHNM